MNLSVTAKDYPKFYQNEYPNTFYYCDKDHPFIAFTTCYCPLCDSISNCITLENDYKEITELDFLLTEKYMELFVKVKNANPELLV